MGNEQDHTCCICGIIFEADEDLGICDDCFDGLHPGPPQIDVLDLTHFIAHERNSE